MALTEQRVSAPRPFLLLQHPNAAQLSYLEEGSAEPTPSQTSAPQPTLSTIHRFERSPQCLPCCPAAHL